MVEALRADGDDEKSVLQTLKRLEAQGLVDDAGLAHRFARSRLEHAGLGPRRIRRALQGRGVDEPLIARALRDAELDVSLEERLMTLARAFWRQRGRLEPPKRLRNLWIFLVRRGFEPRTVHGALARLWPRWVDALDGIDPLEEPDGP